MNTRNELSQIDVDMTSIATLVMWLMCASVGLIGLLVRYPWPQAPPVQPPPVQAKMVRVELTDAAPAPSVQAADEVPSQPPAIDAPAAPPAAPMVAVASPSPSIAFPLPVEGATNIAAPKQAVPQGPATAPATQLSSSNLAPAPIVARKLIFGEGEGAQPRPEYPREAVMARQQGTVVVRLTVGEDGRVQTAQAVVPTPFPLLNQAAVRAVRESWRFNPGAVRTFEVEIEFNLRKRS